MDKKPYRDLNTYYRNLFGGKTAKISLDGGFTCPNRDGTIGIGGCLFCSAGGSGDFAESAAFPSGSKSQRGNPRLPPNGSIPGTSPIFRPSPIHTPL